VTLSMPVYAVERVAAGVNDVAAMPKSGQSVGVGIGELAWNEIRVVLGSDVNRDARRWRWSATTRRSKP
jgi:hypothetical protein